MQFRLHREMALWLTEPNDDGSAKTLNHRTDRYRLDIAQIPILHIHESHTSPTIMNW